MTVTATPLHQAPEAAPSIYAEYYAQLPKDYPALAAAIGIVAAGGEVAPADHDEAPTNYYEAANLRLEARMEGDHEAKLALRAEHQLERAMKHRIARQEREQSAGAALGWLSRNLIKYHHRREHWNLRHALYSAGAGASVLKVPTPDLQ